MKKMLLAMICALCLHTAAHALRTGTYELWGSNHPNGDFTYRGEVYIAPQGDNFALIWRIDNSNVQAGIGLLRKDILSVAYHDLSQNTHGVMCFCQISDSVLEGHWTSFQGATYGREYLVWKTSRIGF